MFKRLMAILSVGVVAAFLTAENGELFAQQKKEATKKEEVSNDDSKGDAKQDDTWPKVKGTIAKIVKVDAEKKTVDVDISGKKQTLTIGKEVKFIGPRGGEGDGFKDDRFVAGRRIKIVMEGTTVKEIHLDNRPRKDKSKDKK